VSIVSIATLAIGASIALTACEKVPDVVFEDDAGSGAPHDSSIDASPVPDAPVGEDAPNASDAPSSDDAGDAEAGLCPGPSTAQLSCCGSVVCRGHQNDCSPAMCSGPCSGCSAVCCLRNNGDFQQCAGSIADCPAP
jgi:hypothetical protein